MKQIDTRSRKVHYTQIQQTLEIINIKEWEAGFGKYSLCVVSTDLPFQSRKYCSPRPRSWQNCYARGTFLAAVPK